MSLNIRPQTSLKRSVSTPGTLLLNWRTVLNQNSVRCCAESVCKPCALSAESLLIIDSCLTNVKPIIKSLVICFICFRKNQF